jgi:thioredoxin reductase
VSELHASTRAPHRRLAAEGKLTCATCHPAHEGFHALAFGDGKVARWSARGTTTTGLAGPSPSGQTVPLVALSVCATCHALSRPDDPAARCIPGRVAPTAELSTLTSACFDEHRSALAAPRAESGVCGRQHGDAHLAALELASDLARRPVADPPAKASRTAYLPAGLAALFATLALVVTGLRSRRRVEARRVLPQAAARKKLPVIDSTTCLGCKACVEVCPFDVLEVEAYVAKVARPDECCGVVSCAEVCPNGSLTIGDGEGVEESVEVHETLESRRVPGLYLAGDLTGVPLIKNAIAQGDRAMTHLHANLEKKSAGDVDADVVVIGAGPAGLSAALRAKALGLSCVVLEQATLAASIRSFPRGKIVHDPPLTLPVEGELWLAEATKEEIVAQWERIVRVRGLDVREGHRVVDVRRGGERGGARRTAEGPFVVTCQQGDASRAFRARRIVLAIGRRGTPKTVPFDAEPGTSEKVHFSLADAASFAGKRVAVVGLGDTAMEAALALSRQPGTRVTLIARASGFRRGKARNIAEVQRAVTAGRLSLRSSTVLRAVGRTGIRVEHLETGLVESLGNDAVFVLVGGLPSWELLETIGVRAPKPEVTEPEIVSDSSA